MKIYKWELIPVERLSDGIQRQMLYGEKAMICRFVIDPHVEVKTHTHESEQYTMILKGKAIMTLDGMEMQINEGDIIYIPSYKPHGIKVLNEGIIAIDIFCPPRKDFINGSDKYLRGE